MLMERAREYRALRAPAEGGQTLIDPPYSALPDLVTHNREQLSYVQYDVQGRSLAKLSATGRRGLLNQAIEYTRQYRSIPERWLKNGSLADVPFLLSGHQPELFHPGVWYKNFVLGSLARRMDAVGIHLLIDSDMCRSVSIRVPTGSAREPHVAAVPYDEPTAEMPHEERNIRNPGILSTFAERASSLIRSLVPDPMVAQLWPLVMGPCAGQKNLGLRLAQGRHALEETWQNETLELPQSAVCGLPEFAWFVAHLLANLPRFWKAHNDALADYRRAHHLRNRAQPVPDLAAPDGWLEAPFWIWSTDDPERRPVFAKQSGDTIVVTDRHKQQFTLSLSADCDASAAAEQLVDLSAHGIKLRTRALTTTLFARLVLSDLFLHGIGGAKYDQVTDGIVQRFFGFEPPVFAAVSATLRLPIAQQLGDASGVEQWQQRLRELRYHPEQFVESNGVAGDKSNLAAELVAAKRRWVEMAKTPQNAAERHRRIVEANDGLQPFVAPLREKIERERDELLQRKRGDAILRSREYSFCLYPRENFNSLLRQSDLL
jgi:hypothetical protein